MLSADEIDRYRRDGHVVRHGAVTERECETLCDHLSALIRKVASEYGAGMRTELEFWKLMPQSRSGIEVFCDASKGSPLGLPPGAWEGFVMRVGHALHVADPTFDAFCRGPAGAGLAELVGAPAGIVQTSVIYKQARSDVVQFGLHQDASYLTTDPESLALAFVALDDMDAENGCLEVVPGSHHAGLGVVLTMGPEGFVPSGRSAPPPAEAPLALPMKRGAIAFLHGRTYHASGPNRSGSSRRALLVHAMSARSRLLPTSWLVDGGGAPPLAPL